jgi:tRNA G26 N,N-dimethylase Trm1
MKTSENSMDLIEKSGKTMVIGSECGHGLIKEQESVPTKKCAKCGRELPTTMFYTNIKNKDGFQDRCKDCQREWNREYQRRKAAERKKANLNTEDKVETGKVVVDTKECTMDKVYSDPELAKFTPRQLMQELKVRGFRWEYMLEPQRKIYFEKI